MIGGPQLVWSLAKSTGLAPELVCAVCEQESGWNEWAIRYEPGFLSKYIAPLYTAGKLTPTEAYTRAMSWGLMQVMGQTAREMGYQGPLPMLCDPPIGLKWGCLKLKSCADKAKGDTGKTLEIYNGGANPEYANQVMARIAKYTQTT